MNLDSDTMYEELPENEKRERILWWDIDYDKKSNEIYLWNFCTNILNNIFQTVFILHISTMVMEGVQR